MKTVVLIAGPTASGKSALALALAERLGGVIVNADSMQVYRDLRVLTARPSVEEEARVPHRLFGHVDAGVNYSVGAYVADAARVLADLPAGQPAIFAGGTGLYFKALMNGLAAIPPIDPAIRDALRARLDREGVEALHAELARRDPEAAARIMVRDRSRILRALEVLDATGRPIADWHRDGLPPVIAADRTIRVFLHPERDELKRRIEARFAAMLNEGALDEVRVLAARNLPDTLPSMKAHGVPWLRRYLRGDISLDEAAAGSIMDTRRYAKRQVTWFRNQMPGWTWVTPEEGMASIETLMQT
ncbi:tRNA (adenosine(37)-N6)-dimethylallyltransferase MiaA [Pseudorhodoplanes sp.]|uniref:tRNA (adenosine(37)-N6)-dimethylallyltransferase MiaA n=1 Tax=Pseudorhodoplanes sp. TaxID=1934341 RepID=UPI002BFD1C8B|nr:tRNA (adenosine(37)-N6)-dimethylallyltransferase MiaA [Pseudorhodoplanes sp.]HWV53357.1 tRNA (adenosine(37)-N6)-dimethylallyltransferase MiaA [Pseudorhodoplanes sp.]